MRHAITAAKVGAAWLPLVALWALFLALYSGGSLPVDIVLTASARSTAGAALLGVGVWWFSGRYPWPERIRARFYLVHVAAAMVYALAWQGSGVLISALRQGRSPWAVFSGGLDLIGWRVLTGVCLYGLVAGVSYSVRIRSRLLSQERVAERAKALAAEARLAALRAQLNPHFLFNALHSLSALVRHDPTGAERAVDRLGDLLRYALDGGDEREVRLSDEWAFTQDYLEMERLRFEDRIRVDTDLEPRALALRVPPFSLQPLVENAIHHSISPRPEGGRISIAAAVVGPELVISVRDDGAGTDPVTQSRSGGRGLASLRQRLEALYGSRASLAVTTSPGAGFAVTMTLPA